MQKRSLLDTLLMKINILLYLTFDFTQLYIDFITLNIFPLTPILINLYHIEIDSYIASLGIKERIK